MRTEAAEFTPETKNPSDMHGTTIRNPAVDKVSVMSMHALSFDRIGRKFSRAPRSRICRPAENS
jgi:hypothetical protein